MPLELNIENTVFSKQIFDAGARSACDQFMHSIGFLMGRKAIVLGEEQRETLFGLSPRELSDLNLLLHRGDRAKVIAFLEEPRETEPRGRGGPSV
jgi:hypothetical protein